MDCKTETKPKKRLGIEGAKSGASQNQNMMVAVRIRPLSTKEIEAGQTSCCSVVNGNVVAIRKEGNAAMYLKSQQGSLNEYCFDAAFDSSSSQYDVYEKTTKKYMQNVIEGYNVTVFAYGATGAGKTHTMMGNTRCDDARGNSEAGIIPNALQDIFKLVGERKAVAGLNESWSVYVSFMEVYNEQVYDLLEPTGKVLSVREDQERGVVVVAGLTKQTVTSTEAVLQLLHQGNRHRKTEATMANQVSSRSHAVLQLVVQHKKRSQSGQELSTDSTLSLIDLAGSERASATANRGSRLQEGANINKSLLALANCINALAGNNGAKKTNVKYRDSKLTHLLKSSLEGKCNLIMIANVNPSDVTFEDSHNTLKYANRAKNIKVAPVCEQQQREGTWMEREAHLREENAMLRARVTELEGIIAQLQNSRGDESQNAILKCHQQMDVVETVDVSRIEEMDVTQMQEEAAVACTDVYLDVSTDATECMDFQAAEQELDKLTKVAGEGQRRMSNIIQRRCSVVDGTGESSSSAGETSSNVDSAESARPTGLQRRDDAKLKDRIAALSRITQEQQRMFDSILKDPTFLDTDRDKNKVRMSLNVSSTDVSATPAHDEEFGSDLSLPQLNQSGSNDIISMKGRLITSQDRKETKSRASRYAARDNDAVKKKRAHESALSAEMKVEPQALAVEIFDEENIDQPRQKKRRSSLIPTIKASSRSQAALTERSNVLPESSEGDSLKKSTVDLKPLTRAAAKKKRMSLLGSASQMTENQVSSVKSRQSISRKPLQDSREKQDDSVSRPTGVRTRRNSIAMSVRRLANRDL